MIDRRSIARTEAGFAPPLVMPTFAPYFVHPPPPTSRTRDPLWVGARVGAVPGRAEKAGFFDSCSKRQSTIPVVRTVLREADIRACAAPLTERRLAGTTPDPGGERSARQSHALLTS